MNKIDSEPIYFEDYDTVVKDLTAGKCSKCIVRGTSMRPFFKSGKDYLILAPIRDAVPASPKEAELISHHNKKPDKKKRNSTSSADRMTIRRRDIVLFRYRDTGTYRLLRVVHVWGTLLLLRGDACYGAYERATVSDVLGIAVNGTFWGGIKTSSTSFLWRSLSKIWTASYRMRHCFRRVFRRQSAMLAVLLSVLFLLFPSCSERSIVTVRNGRFIKHDAPYYFIGTNFWYGAILGSEGPGGDRTRLCNELDSLHALGLDNLRILAGAEGREGVTDRIEPVLQKTPGKYDRQLLEGLDFLLAEMGKREMEAVLYLNNAWEWSGGFSQYLEWAGHGRAPIPSVDGYESYCEYVGHFHRSDSARLLFDNHLRYIVSRVNSITGKAYRDDPTIFSWQICNEPRPFGTENKEAFAAWISRCAALIKSVDPNHLVSVGSEGRYGCENDIELWKNIGKDPNIDYLNIHIWPLNWGWVAADNLSEGFGRALRKSRAYLYEHKLAAAALHKPLVIEEFGFPRDGKQFSSASPVSLRNGYYDFLLDEVVREARKGGIVAGCNFWGWGGDVQPPHTVWEKGDPFTGDPAQEPQGLYSVFSTDRSTLELLKERVNNCEKSK